MSPSVDPDDFLRAMQERWTSFGNVPSWRLAAGWRKQCEVFNSKIADYGTSHAKDWHVLQTKTGTGKTQGTVVYAALLSKIPPERQPGMLIVTRLIADADSIAAEINELAGSRVAASRHSESEIGLSELKNFPILVITHAAYTLALEEGLGFDTAWSYFMDLQGDTRRKLIVIDEAIDVIEITKLTCRDMDQLIGYASHARERFPAELRALETFQHIFRRMVEIDRGESVPESVLVNDERASALQSFGTVPDLGPLREYMRTYRYIGSAEAHTYDEPPPISWTPS